MNAVSQRFCGACGTVLERTCSSCGGSNPTQFSFCGSCGSSLQDTDTPIRVSAGIEERRWATVLFADLSGFTSLSERADPEDVRDLIDRCMGSMAEIVEKFGGFTSRVIGDELLALFGAPVAHDDDPERAVRTALEMQHCAVEKAEEFGRLPMRVGINTGEMMFAPVGPPGAREHTVMGDAVNTAKRLQSAAPLGGVMVGQETYRASRAGIRFQRVDPIEAKGKAELVEAWLAVEPVAEAGSRAVSEWPFVGRERELDLLGTIWEATVAETRPHLVTLMGAPGIGKTRIEREFVTQVGSDALVLHGRSLPYGERTGYGAFAEQIKGACGIYASDGVPTAREKLERFVADLFPEAESVEVISHLAVILGLGNEGQVRDRQPLFFSARRLLEALAARAPVVLVFEDAHWADNSLLDLIEVLGARMRDAPVLLLALARPELVDRRPSWGGGSVTATTLTLDSLAPSEARALATRLLPRVADGEVLSRLADVAGGNPLFLEELAASYSERTAGFVEGLPTSIQATIAARLDALPPTERRVLLDAAVVGKIFWRGVLEAAAPDEPVWEALDSLHARDLIRRQPVSRIQGDEEYAFKHMLIREVAYATLPKAVRRQRHATIASHVERAAGDRVSEHASLLAHHFREAGETDRAVGYLLHAAEHANRAFAAAEEISLYDQTLELIAPDDPRRDGMLLARALARANAGDMQGAAGEFDVLIPRLHGEELVRALATRAKVAFWLSDGSRMSEYAGQLHDLGDEMDDDTPRALGLAMHSFATSMVGALTESIDLGERALELWTPSAPEGELAFLHGMFGLTHYWRGDLERALELLDRGLTLGREAQVDVFLVNGSNYALSLAGIGRYEEAIVLFEEMTAKGREYELVPRWWPRAMNMTAGALREIGDRATARGLSEVAREGAESVFPTGAVQAQVDLLFTDLGDGDAGAADSAWTKLWDRSTTLHGFHEWLVQDRLLEARAEIALATGRTAEAAETALAAIEHADHYGRPKYETQARCVLAAAFEAMGRHEEALSHAIHAVEDAERLRHPPTLWRAATQLGALRYATGDDAGAETAYGRAQEVVDGVAAGLSPERRAVFLASEPLARLRG